MRRPPWVDLAVLLGGLVLMAAMVWFVIVRPGQNAEAARRAKGDATVATAEAEKAQAAVPIVERTFTTIRETERVTNQGTAAILAAPGAASVLPADVAAAGRRALCLHALYHDHPACEQLPHAGAAEPEGAHPGRPAAG